MMCVEVFLLQVKLYIKAKQSTTQHKQLCHQNQHRAMYNARRIDGNTGNSETYRKEEAKITEHDFMVNAQVYIIVFELTHDLYKTQILYYIYYENQEPNLIITTKLASIKNNNYICTMDWKQSDILK